MKTKRGLRDVAQAAHVSLATVSRVANDASTVDPKLQKRVKEAAKALGVDLVRRNKPKILVFVLSNRDLLHPFHSRALAGAQKHCAALGWDMLFLRFDYSPSVPWNELHLPLIMLRRDIVQGAILSGTNSQNLLLSLTRRNLPFAVLGSNVIGEWGPENYDVVWSDDIGGAYEITRYLQSIGHRDIWHIGNYQLPWFSRCCEGYRRAMAEAGLPSRVSMQHSQEPEEIGYLATKSILARSEPVSAIFAGTDATAWGVYKAAEDCGVRIPKDISVVGLGDAVVAGLNPALTTGQEFPEQIGSNMAEVVLRRIAQPDLAPQHVTIYTKLVKRESCRPIQSEPRTEKQQEAGVIQSAPDTQLDTKSAK
jgi:DNA-binding LacI/PurR family transcriptional regulator